MKRSWEGFSKNSGRRRKTYASLLEHCEGLFGSASLTGKNRMTFRSCEYRNYIVGLSMNNTISLAIIAGGVLLLIFGINA